MQCPDCGGNKLKIDVVFSGSVSCKFHGDEAFELCEATELDSHWHDDSACLCPGCGWRGHVREAKPTEQEGDLIQSLESDLQVLQRELKSGTCPETVQAPLRNLMEAVRALRLQVALLERIKSSRVSDDSSHSGDTVFF